MRAQQSAHNVRRACLRCKIHKRRCDKSQPQCSLCKRLRQVCQYENATSSASQFTDTENAFTPQGIKSAIIRKLSGLRPEAIASIYERTIAPWFAFVSEVKLHKQLPQKWEDANADLILLAFIISLFDASPQISGHYCSVHPDTLSDYLSSKSWLALLEGAGVNSPDLVNARLLVTLFEMVNGLYPAAYLSIAATVQAARALSVYGSQEVLLVRSSGISDTGSEESITALWRCIVILDRYIAVEHGNCPTVTCDRTVAKLQDPLGDRSPALVLSPLRRAFEASNHLELVRTAIYEPTSLRSFNVEEAELIVTTLTSFTKVLEQHIDRSGKLSSTCLALANTGLLLMFENGLKAGEHEDRASHCRAGSSAGLATLVDEILKPFEELEGNAASAVRTISPFAIYLIYKTAAILTARLQVGFDLERYLPKIRAMREILKLIGRRWVAAGRYLRLLDENTTPRMLSRIKHDV